MGGACGYGVGVSVPVLIVWLPVFRNPVLMMFIVLVFGYPLLIELELPVCTCLDIVEFEPFQLTFVILSPIVQSLVCIPPCLCV